MSFGRLRCLDLSEACYLLPGSRTFAASCFDANVWSQLLAPSLEHLSFPDTRDIGFRAALAFTESLPKLKQVTAERGISHPRNGDSWHAPHRFLDRHAAQLEELGLGATPLITVRRVLLFADQWSRLSTLRLAIKVPFFDIPAIGDASPRSVSLPVHFLMALGSLPALESLYLAVGSSEVWKHQWKPDHALLRSFLGRLTKLRHLAFMLDTYPGMPDNAPMEGYDPPDFVSVCKFLEDKMESENYLDPSKYAAVSNPLLGVRMSARGLRPVCQWMTANTTCGRRRSSTLPFCRIWSGCSVVSGPWAPAACLSQTANQRQLHCGNGAHQLLLALSENTGALMAR